MDGFKETKKDLWGIPQISSTYFLITESFHRRNRYLELTAEEFDERHLHSH